jgi:hypothetical protein
MYPRLFIDHHDAVDGGVDQRVEKRIRIRNLGYSKLWHSCPTNGPIPKVASFRVGRQKRPLEPSIGLPGAEGQGRTEKHEHSRYKDRNDNLMRRHFSLPYCLGEVCEALTERN